MSSLHFASTDAITLHFGLTNHKSDIHFCPSCRSTEMNCYPISSLKQHDIEAASWWNEDNSKSMVSASYENPSINEDALDRMCVLCIDSGRKRCTADWIF